MAHITKRRNKEGLPSYLIRVYLDENENGKQKIKSITWKPPLNMRESTADNQAKKQATLFEDKLKKGLIAFDGKTTFKEYAENWIAHQSLAFKTIERYKGLLTRIYPAIGHIKIEKLQAHYLQEFYKSFANGEVNKIKSFAKSNILDKVLKERKLSYEKFSKMVSVSSSTISTAANGKNIKFDTAERISKTLNLPIEKLFKINIDNSGLSEKTILHHHRLISVILETAKRERLIPFNVASEHMKAPKVRPKEAKYLDDEQARKFLNLLLNEEDIRAKTALIINLFTGLRRGELCGLSWQDIDEEKCIISISKASQYQTGKGVVEVTTKTHSSNRFIDISKFVIEILKEYKKWWFERKMLFGKDWEGKENRLFVQERGKPINPDTINFWLEKFIRKHSLPQITPHSLRHTFATLQVASGVDIRTLQSRTGHAQASTLLNTYSHAFKKAQVQASNALEKVLLKDSTTA